MAKNVKMHVNDGVPMTHIAAKYKEIFDLVRIEDIDEYNKESGLERIKIIATDGASHYQKEYLELMDSKTFKQWVNYHFSTCERMDLIGASNHTLDILKNRLSMIMASKVYCHVFAIIIEFRI